MLVWSPSICSCSIAAGLLTSKDTKRTFFPEFFNIKPILAADVVFPDPCKPTSIIEDGGDNNLISFSLFSPPSNSVNLSWTSFITIWSGFTDFVICLPLASKVISDINCLTTSSATSASIKANLTSFIAFAISLSDSEPLPLILSKAETNLSLKLSNICLSILNKFFCTGERNSKTSVTPQSHFYNKLTKINVFSTSY